MTLIVLWEDRALGPIHRFGPHAFLTACVASQLTRDPQGLLRSEAIQGVACAGNSNVVRALESPTLWNRASHVVAVLDGDKLHELLGLTGADAFRLVPPDRRAAWLGEREAQIRHRAADRGPDLLSVVILESNLESLLQVIAGEPVKKDPLTRDKTLQRAFGDTALIRKAMVEMPTWATLVETVAARLMPP